MKLVCPSCGAQASAEAWRNDAIIRNMMRDLSSLPPPVQKGLFGYLSLFRPPRRGLAWKKAARLMRELGALVAAGHIEVQGRVARPCPPGIWAMGMGQMEERKGGLSLPLKNHNYLRQVVWQLADEADRDREAARRNSEMHGTRRPGAARNPDGMSEVMRKYMELHPDENT